MKKKLQSHSNKSIEHIVSLTINPSINRANLYLTNKHTFLQIKDLIIQI